MPYRFWSSFTRRDIDIGMLSIYQIRERLKDLTFAEAAAKLGKFDSYSRSVASALVLCRSPTPVDTIRVFLQWRNICDAPWWSRSIIANCLRDALREVTLADHLDPTERIFYDALPAVVPVRRGCESKQNLGQSIYSTLGLIDATIVVFEAIQFFIRKL
jgi:hypothetical protein